MSSCTSLACFFALAEAMSESNAVTVSIMRPAHSSMSTKSEFEAAEMILLSDTEAMPLLHQ